MNKKILFWAFVTMLFMGCKNEQNEPEQPQQPEQTTEQQMVNSYFISPVAFNGTFVEMSNAVLYTANSRSALPARDNATDYPIISWTPQETLWPVDIQVDYGTEPVVGIDGLEHYGRMAIHSTGRFEEKGSVITPTFTNFYVYGNVLSARQKIKNMGPNDNGDLVFDVTVDEGKLGTQDQLIYSEHTQRELVNGLMEDGWMNPDFTTHTYSITGWMKTESKVDTIPGYQVNIDETEPMLIAVGDIYPIGGVLTIDLDREIVYDMSGIKITYRSLTLEFIGKQGNQYAAKVDIEYKLGPVTQHLKVAFMLDEKGIVQGSIRPITD